MPTILPLGNQCLVRLLPLPERSSLIILPPHQQSCRRAVVEAIGPRVRDAEVGQVVLVHGLVGLKVGESRVVPEDTLLAYEP